MEARNFLNQHRIFRVETFGEATGLSERGRENALRYYRDQGRILSVRRGLYWVVPPGSTAENCPVDAFLIAGHISKDSVIAAHSALELHGRAYSSFNEVQFLTTRKIQPFDFRGIHYRPLRFPPALSRLDQQQLGVEQHDRSGEFLKVTCLERCLVDALDRPELCGGWEEVWRSLDMIEYLDLDLVCRYVRALGKATTAAKTGWYLEINRSRLMVDKKTLETLHHQRPASPHYIASKPRQANRMLARWNLVIPVWLDERQWEETS